MASHAVNAKLSEPRRSLLDFLPGDRFEEPVLSDEGEWHGETTDKNAARLTEQVEHILGRRRDNQSVSPPDEYLPDETSGDIVTEIHPDQSVYAPATPEALDCAPADIQKFATAAALLGEMAHKILRQADPHAGNPDILAATQAHGSQAGPASLSGQPGNLVLEDRLDRFSVQMTEMSDMLSRRFDELVAKMDCLGADQKTATPPVSPATVQEEKIGEFIRAIADLKAMRDRIQAVSLDRRPSVR